MQVFLLFLLILDHKLNLAIMACLPLVPFTQEFQNTLQALIKPCNTHEGYSYCAHFIAGELRKTVEATKMSGAGTGTEHRSSDSQSCIFPILISTCRKVHYREEQTQNSKLHLCVLNHHMLLPFFIVKVQQTEKVQESECMHYKRI